jgi:2-C-methyl-D-erythritol 4-phosphate cytidylyltransferase/2-C-methyl-D-erythritol 2,4-cyclodiphosphate synthase
MRCVGLIVAGGRGTRFGSPEPKQYALLGNQPLLVWSLRAFEQAFSVDGIVLVVDGEHLSRARALTEAYSLRKLVGICAGGAGRADSVRAGLAALPGEAEIVAIHDAARPLVTPGLIDRVMAAAVESGAALPVVSVGDTVKRGAADVVETTVDRRGLFLAQTPQTFQVGLIRGAYAQHGEEDDPVTDDAQLVERLGHAVRLVEGDPANFKITRPGDLRMAEDLLRGRDFMARDRWPRTGVGYDVHRLVPGRKLVLGGVTLDYPLGLLGHSDADVLCHAVGDALLGAASLGDLGTHFPPGDPKWLGASSLDLLARIVALVEAAGYTVGNVDLVAVCERPKLAPHTPAMRENLARCLKVGAGCVSVKATTTEGLGFCGREEGIAAYATVLLAPARERPDVPECPE